MKFEIKKKHLGKTILMNYGNGDMKEWVVVSVKTKYFGVCESVERAKECEHCIEYFDRKTHSPKKWTDYSFPAFYENKDEYKKELIRRENVEKIKNRSMSYEQTVKILEIINDN